MNSHPYLRAYLAGIAVPTPFLLVIMTAYIVARLIYHVPVPIERIIVFPMAVVPNLWGVWNMLYLLLHSRRHLPIGLHGAILPFLLAPMGFTIATILDFPFPPFPAKFLAALFPIGLVVYYLAWKHLVGFLNKVLGIA